MNDVNAIWGDANFAGKIDSSEANGAFWRTFYSMRSLTGAAQTFIDNKLGGINPSWFTEAFTGTQVTDYASLHPNWQ